MADVTTVGTLLINDALPEELRKDQHKLDKKGVHKLFMELAEKYPDRYKEVLKSLSDVGRTAVWTEGLSVSLAGLRKSKAKGAILGPVMQRVRAIIDDDTLDPKERKAAIINELIPISGPLQDAVLEEARSENSPFAVQIDSGARGNKSAFASLRGADLLTTDQRGDLIPVPLEHSYAEGFTPAEYFAASYGQRKGQLSVKLATADAGFLNKQLVNAAHRQVITREVPEPRRLLTGLPVDINDKDNIGAVLATQIGDYPAGTVITDRILEDLKDKDHDEILIHSPLTEISEDGGISAWAAGRRTRQGLHVIGDNIGIPAAQAIGERLSQGSLNAKHSAGVGDRIKKSGMEYINRLIQAPEHFPEAGPLANADGIVSDIRVAPQGGHYIKIGEEEHYAGPDLGVTVKVGDNVEQGDDLTDGVPHPTQLIRLRGIGEARRVYTSALRDALNDSGAPAHRRNVESVVAGLMNWAEIQDPDGVGDAIYGDVVPYGRLAATYEPRPDAKEADPEKLVGNYLEEPALHYTPGTRITKKVAKRLKKWGINGVRAHVDPPAFEPYMVRGLHSVYHDPDWKVRQAGFYTARAFEKSVHRGLESDTQSTSFVPALTTPKVLGRSLGTLGKYGGTPGQSR